MVVKNLEKELLLLKRELAMHDTLANRSQVIYDPLSEQQRYEIRQQVRAYLDGKSDDIEVRRRHFCYDHNSWQYYTVSQKNVHLIIFQITLSKINRF